MNINKISDYMMNIGILIGVYGFYKIYVSNKGLPEGVCPIENNNHILYTSIIILVLSLILSTYDDIKKRKSIN